MSSVSPVRPRIIFGVATLLGVFSSLQAQRLAALNGDHPVWAKLLALNLAYWYVPAALAPLIFWISCHARFERGHRARAVAAHVTGAVVFSLVHLAAMAAVRAALPREPWVRVSPSVSWSIALQREYVTNLDWAIMTYCFLVGLWHAIDFHREAQERAVRTSRLEARLLEAQLQALQRQLHPHFLFNTLNAIAGLMRSDVEAADVMIARLSELLRMTLQSSGHQEVPLREELDVLSAYLAIEQIRFRDRLTLQASIAPETLDALVPNLLLQPLVENAVRHGIAPQSRPGCIELRASRDGERLRLEIGDTGVGLPPDRLQQLNAGIGLSNTRTRLERLYGAQHRFLFLRRQGGGLTVVIVIPFRVSPERRKVEYEQAANVGGR